MMEDKRVRVRAMAREEATVRESKKDKSQSKRVSISGLQRVIEWARKIPSLRRAIK